MAGTAKLKEGYLQKYGNFVTRWRRKHFALYQDGQLAWSDGRGSTPDKVINVKTECSMLRVGAQVGSDAPSVPSGTRRDFLFALTARGKNYYLLATTEQDIVEWLQVLYHAKGIPPPGQQQQQQPQQPQQAPGAPMGVPPQGQLAYPSQPAAPGQPPPYGFNPNLMGPPAAAAAPYPQAGQPPPPMGGYPPQQPYPAQHRPYPTQQGGPVVAANRQPVQQTVVVQERSRSGLGGDGLAMGLLAGYALGGHRGWGWGGGYGYGGYGGGYYGGGWGGGLHFHGHHHGHFDHHHHHDHHHDHHDMGGHDDYGGGDYGGGGDFGGDDFGGGDFGGGDFDGGGDFGD